MKIIYYSPHPGLGLHDATGYGTHMREMIHAFRLLGHEVLPVIMGGSNTPVAPVSIAPANKGFKQRIKPFIPAYLWETLKDIELLRFDRYAQQQLETQIADFQPDLVYERANYMQLSGVKAAKKLGVKHILEVNSPYVEERENLQGKSWLVGKAEAAERMLLHSTDLICVVSSALKSYLAQRSSVQEEKFVITPNAINPQLLTDSFEVKENIKNLYKLNDKIVFGFVGSFFPWHGIDLMIQAFKSLIVQYPDIRLLIVGDGSIRTELAQLAHGHPEIIFTGSVPHAQVFGFIDVMDVTMMANSNWYGSPVKIFEYGAMGKAIIAPDNIPVRDVMSPDVDGVLVKPTIDSLQQAMAFFLANPDQRARMAVHFQQKVLTQHTWQHTAQNILNRVFPLNS